MTNKLLDWLGDDPTNPDKLLPELRECYVEDGPIGPMIKHPLVNEIMFHSWKLANEMFERKQELIAERLKSRDYLGVLILYERPWRLEMLHHWWKHEPLTLLELRGLLPWAWIDCEMPSQFGTTPLILFQAAGFLTDIEGKETREDIFGDKLALITVYRGCGSEYRDGVSWTRNPERAAWFAGRFNTGKDGEVWQAEIVTSDVLGVFLGRGEDEIVVPPHQLVNLEQKE